MSELVVAVDGGGVKTDLALLDTAGTVFSMVRGGRSSPHYIGVDGCVELLERLLNSALTSAGIGTGPSPRIASAQIMVAGADLPEELAELRAAVKDLDWTERPVVDNDTFALLRSGTDRGWGIAVVCGGGINCVGLAPDGRQARFPSLGQITGDWGGGYDVGLAALMAAARSADGRGPRTVLESEVPAYYGLDEPFDVARALHLGELPHERLGELARVVLPLADEDAVAGEIVDRLADEVVAMATVAIRRLGLEGSEPDVVLGGGLVRAALPSTIDRVTAGLRAVAPDASVLVAPTAPIVGAALLGLDELGVEERVSARARSELHAAFLRIEGDGSRVSDGDVIAAGELRRASHG